MRSGIRARARVRARARFKSLKQKVFYKSFLLPFIKKILLENEKAQLKAQCAGDLHVCKRLELIEETRYTYRRDLLIRARARKITTKTCG